MCRLSRLGSSGNDEARMEGATVPALGNNGLKRDSVGGVVDSTADSSTAANLYPCISLT